MIYLKYCYIKKIMIYFFMHIGGKKLKKQTRKSRKMNKAYQKASLIFIFIFAIAIFLVILELKLVIKKKK